MRAAPKTRTMTAGLGTLTTDADDPDPDFDQRLMPRGSFFVELFNPSTSDTDVRPAEFSDVDGSGVPLNNGVQLNKVVTDGPSLRRFGG
jgi:hypothetical protein